MGKSNQLSTPTHTTMEDMATHTPTTPTVVEPSILSRNVKPKLNPKPKPIQMLGMDMDTDTDHTGDTEDTDLLTIIHTHMDTMVDTMVDTVDTTTENRLLQYKYRIVATSKTRQKPSTKRQKKKTHIYPELSVKQEYL